jgi:hypothetical protein
MKRDKEKVLDEVWTEEHIKSFLHLKPVVGLDHDFHTLLKAYQSMRAHDFKIFIDYFCAQNRNLNATGPDGETVLGIIRQHRHGSEYAAIMEQAGA